MVIRIGYCGPERKWKAMKWDELIAYAKTKDVELVYIDLTKPIHGHFDLLIHKLTYFMDGHDYQSNDQVSRFYNFCQLHPEIPVIDPLDSVVVTLDREEMNQALSDINWPSELNINVPKFRLLHDVNQLDSIIEHLNFPILAKPKDATSTAENHTLRIATSIDQLRTVPTPTILQEYINHGGVIYKCYTLGDHLEVGCRASTRDVAPGESFELDFHSQRSNDPNGFWAPPPDLDAISIPREDLSQISRVLRASLGMELLGFDIIIDHRNRYWVIDINYFPGYTNVDDKWAKFLTFFLTTIDNSHK